uniref:Uncharacterized protein n=1 Tax=viral metagenome TaxID=1070528 RepID=A0A6M3JPV8_9ZZZZ
MIMITHSGLVLKGERWLYGNSQFKNRYKANVVFRELVTWCRETPDLLGWTRGSVTSILIEAKVSRGDFKAECRKLHRRVPERAMGNFRFYLTPYGLIRPEEVPGSWGLLWLSKTAKSIRLVKPAEYQKANTKEEYKFLLSVVRRFKATATINGTDFKTYLDYKDKRDEN